MRFAWMVGETDELGSQIQEEARELHNAAMRSDTLKPRDGYPQLATPPIIWVKPHHSSAMPRPQVEDGADEFYIFQTPKAPNEEVIDDYEQELVINGELVDRLAKIGVERLVSIFEIENDSIDELSAHSDYYARLHLEGHNQGHFIGPWPLDRIKKDHESYDFIEELRACLVAVAMFDARDDTTPKMTQALALQVLATRLLVHGKTAYDLDSASRSRQQVREIIVPTILVERAIRDEAIMQTPHGFRIYSDRLVASMLTFLGEIHENETRARDLMSNKRLHEFTTTILKQSFPSGDYSPHIKFLLENADTRTYN